MYKARRFARLAVAASVVGASLLAAAPAHADVIYVTKWKITHVGSAYTTYGSWRNCQDVIKSSKSSTATCSISTTVTNTLTGTVSVTVADINAAVGYSKGTSHTVDSSRSFSIAAGESGELQWRAEYSSKKVTQTQYRCLANGNGCSSTGTTSTAVASKYTQPAFRFHQS